MANGIGIPNYAMHGDHFYTNFLPSLMQLINFFGHKHTAIKTTTAAATQQCDLLSGPDGLISKFKKYDSTLIVLSFQVFIIFEQNLVFNTLLTNYQFES